MCSYLTSDSDSKSNSPPTWDIYVADLKHFFMGVQCHKKEKNNNANAKTCLNFRTSPHIKRNLSSYFPLHPIPFLNIIQFFISVLFDKTLTHKICPTCHSLTVAVVEKPAETQTSLRLASIGAPNSRSGGHEFESPMRRELGALI
jgi:hypothetical protein